MENQIVKAIFSEAGVVAALLLVSNIVWFKMYLMERKDRTAAWRANNDFKKEVIAAMKEVVPVLAILKDRHERS